MLSFHSSILWILEETILCYYLFKGNKSRKSVSHESSQAHLDILFVLLGMEPGPCTGQASALPLNYNPNYPPEVLNNAYEDKTMLNMY